LPKAVLRVVGEADYYDVTAEDGRIVLTPVRVQRADAVRAKLAEPGITEDSKHVCLSPSGAHFA